MGAGLGASVGRTRFVALTRKRDGKGFGAMDYEYDKYADLGEFSPAAVPEGVVKSAIGAAVLLVSAMVAVILALAH